MIALAQIVAVGRYTRTVESINDYLDRRLDTIGRRVSDLGRRIDDDKSQGGPLSGGRATDLAEVETDLRLVQRLMPHAKRTIRFGLLGIGLAALSWAACSTALVFSLLSLADRRDDMPPLAALWLVIAPMIGITVQLFFDIPIREWARRAADFRPPND